MSIDVSIDQRNLAPKNPDGKKSNASYENVENFINV